MANNYYQPIGQGPAKQATDEDLQRDETGFTNPNLHRRIDPKDPVDSDEVAKRNYDLSISNVDSYLTIQVNTHDEDSEDSEIP